MDVYDAIFSRRTVRDFSEKEIDSEIVKRIVSAGLQAPSNNHLRQWEFIIANDRHARAKVIDKIGKSWTAADAVAAVDNWGMVDKDQREMYIDAIPKQYRMLLDAGCLIVPCFQQKKPLLKPESLSSLNGFASIWCCIENILLAAVSEGIYGVTRIPGDEEIMYIKETLNIPEGYEIPCYLALGYPGENLDNIKQHPVKVEEKMHFNQW